jgi:hypothetical protein
VNAPVVFDYLESALAEDRRITTRQTNNARNTGGFDRGLLFKITVYHIVLLLS